ncbi:protein late bloomer [Drosophila guanche]|uniref:Blast:Protein late bloomer n=1 Tax=Drosophila guanche TaxID=7266 RepID=A0A3B0IYX1_DROGU|nr:protein late bloomer [Drosophila guanche]SPP73087.1 blast:Protein late bloomer [Drosophila guanche]
MNRCYNTIKLSGLLANLLYMLLGIGVMCGAGLGLQAAEPNTPEHTYFVKSLVLGGTICMIVMFGCYGLICNLLCVNLIFTLFILICLGAEYLQLHHYHSTSHKTQGSAWQQLELAWHGLDSQPELMHQYEATQHCCGHDNSTDYRQLHLLLPASCYQANDTYQQQVFPRGCLETLSHSQRYIEHRDKLFMWSIVGLEIIILLQTAAFSVLLYRLRQQRRLARRQVPPGVRREPRSNHVRAGSRAQLLHAGDV